MKRTEIIDALKAELKFLDGGGYGTPFRSGLRPTLLFKDSPRCLNFNAEDPLQPCRKCMLMRFVPEDKQQERTPCHHIPMTSDGDTLASLYLSDTQSQIDTSFRTWIEGTIYELEQQLEKEKRA